MNPERPTEQRITQWLIDDAPHGLSDRVLDATFERTRATAQVSVFPGWRTYSVTPRIFTIVAGAAAIVAVLVIGAALLPGSQHPSVGVPAPTPAPSIPTAASAAPTASASAAASGSACEIPAPLGTELISACRYTTNVMQPAFSFGDVSGWIPAIETVRGLELQAVLAGGNPASEGLAIFTVDRVAAKPCDPTPRSETTPMTTVPFQPTPGQVPAEFFAWLAKTPLKFGTPTPVSVGGHPGLAVTIPPDDGSLAPCGGGIEITWTTDTPGELGTESVGPGVRLSVVEIDGKAVVFEEYAPANRFTRLDAATNEFLASIRTP